MYTKIDIDCPYYLQNS